MHDFIRYILLLFLNPPVQIPRLLQDLQRADPDNEGGGPQHASLPHVCLLHLYWVNMQSINQSIKQSISKSTSLCVPPSSIFGKYAINQASNQSLSPLPCVCLQHLYCVNVESINQSINLYALFLKCAFFIYIR